METCTTIQEKACFVHTYRNVCLTLSELIAIIHEIIEELNSQWHLFFVNCTYHDSVEKVIRTSVTNVLTTYALTSNIKIFTMVCCSS